MKPIFIILIVFLSIILVLLLLLYFVYRFTFYSPVKNQNDDLNLPDKDFYDDYRGRIKRLISSARSKEFFEIETKSYDGLTLKAFVHLNKENNKFAVCFHGYRGTPFRDFSGGTSSLIEMGYNVVLVQQRAHLHSGGHSITFGHKERFDVITWINKLIELYGDDIDITLYGISMGAATILAASSLNLPSNVKRIVADCPFNSPKDILISVMKQMSLPVKLCYPFLVLSSLIFCGFNPSKLRIEEEVKKAKIPILIIHGTGDTLVPYEMSVKIYEENKDKVHLEFFEGAEHGFSYLVDTNRYEKIIKEFVE